MKEYKNCFNDEANRVRVRRDINRGAHLMVKVPGRHEVLRAAVNEKGKINAADVIEANVSWQRSMELAEAQNERGRYFITEQSVKGQSWDKLKVGGWIKSNGFHHETAGDVVIITNCPEVANGLKVKTCTKS